MELKQNTPTEIKKAIESVKNGQYAKGQKERMIKTLNAQLMEKSVAKSFEGMETENERNYATSIMLTMKANMPEDKREGELNALDDIYGSLLEADEIKKQERNELRQRDLNKDADIINKANEAHASGLISGDKWHEIVNNTVTARSLKLNGKE
jgi:hypothetical protein